MLNQIEKFFGWMTSKNLSSQTKYEYKYYLKKLIDFGEVSKGSVDSFLERYPNNVARSFVKNLIEFFGDNPEVLEEENILPEEISHIKIPRSTGRIRKRVSNLVTKEDINAIADEIYADGNINENNKLKLKLMVFITYLGALRKGELGSIKVEGLTDDLKYWNRAEQKDGEIIVLGKGNKEGFCILPYAVMEELYQWFKVQNYREIDLKKSIWKIGMKQWDKLFRRYSFKALGRQVNLHRLRHSRLTELMNKGVPIETIKEFARHTDISSTQVYLHPSREKIRDDVQGL